MLKLIIVLILLINIQINFALPLSQCIATRVQKSPINQKGSCEYGDADGMTGAGKFVTTINEAFYSTGTKCGDCFEVSGPNGKAVTVRVVNVCDKNTCPGEKPLFLLSPDAFNAISVGNSSDVIYDSSFRKVSCGAQGSLKGQISNDTNTFYLNVLLYNNEIGISKVSVQGTGMAAPQEMVRQNSAQFVLTCDGQKITFPINMTVVSEYGDSVTTTIKSNAKLSLFEFKSNFKLPSPAPVKDAPEQCLLSLTPLQIYTDKLGEGWDYWSSKNYNNLNASDAGHPASGKYALCLQLSKPGSGLVFTRSGGFQVGYYTGVQFDVMPRDRDFDGLKVYFAYGKANWWSLPQGTTLTKGEWSNFTVNFSDIKHTPIETSITFGSEDVPSVELCFDNVQLVLNPDYEKVAYESDLYGGIVSTTTGKINDGSMASSTTGAASTTGSSSKPTATPAHDETESSQNNSNQLSLNVFLFSLLLLVLSLNM